MFELTQIVPCEMDDMEVLAHGFAMTALVKGETVSIDYIKVDPESEGVMVVHNRTDEVIFPIGGELIGEVGEHRTIVRPGDCLKIKRGTPHKFTNAGKAGAGFISVCCPPFSMDDVIIIEGKEEAA